MSLFHMFFFYQKRATTLPTMPLLAQRFLCCLLAAGKHRLGAGYGSLVTFFSTSFISTQTVLYQIYHTGATKCSVHFVFTFSIVLHTRSPLNIQSLDLSFKTAESCLTDTSQSDYHECRRQ